MAGRKGDITMVVAQDNAARSLMLESVDESMGKVQPVLGYAANELVGQNFRKFLAPEVDEQIEDYLEFDAEGRDFADVISKVRNFSLVGKSGKPVKLKMRVQRDVSMDRNARFLILMRGEDKISEGVLKELAELKERATPEEVTELRTSDTFLAAAKIVHNGVKHGNAIASLAIIAIDDFARIGQDKGEEAVNALLKEVALRCIQTFRDADVVAYAGEGQFGVLLLEADATGAQIPLQRLRATVANQPTVSCTVSIAFRTLRPEETPEEAIAACEDKLGDNQGDGNQVYQAE